MQKELSQPNESIMSDIYKKISDLERISIQATIDPTTALYLNKIIVDKINEYIALLPTQTYSTSTPTGSAPTGSIWMYNSGVLATNAIYAYNGGWIQIK